jgi:PIN domain nuclease of toxin-antitoxin system
MLISPVLLLELALLEETGQIKVRAQAIIAELQESLALSICDLPFTEVAVVSLQQKWTRDPFDRLIVAQAAVRRRSIDHERPAHSSPLQRCRVVAVIGGPLFLRAEK